MVIVCTVFLYFIFIFHVYVVDNLSKVGDVQKIYFELFVDISLLRSSEFKKGKHHMEYNKVALYYYNVLVVIANKNTQKSRILCYNFFFTDYFITIQLLIEKRFVSS